MSFTFFKQPWFLLCLIVLLAAFLRFYQVGTNPPSLTWDEVAWGYNAYAVGIDGKDEFGHFLPFTSFVSFGDYKPPVYAYLSVVPIWIFGLTEFAVRFPSAFFGTLTVLITYFLVKELFLYKDPSENKRVRTEYTALVASLILAVSPWHIMLSRAAFEANVASFFIVTGIWLFLYSVRKKSILLILSVICFVLTIYTFNSTRVAAPLLCAVLFLSHIKSLLKMKNTAIFAIIVGIVILLPIVPFLLSSQAKLRYQEVNIFSDVSLVKLSNQEIANDHNSLVSKLIHNRRVVYADAFLQHYFDNLNPSFLFIQGDHNPKFSTQDVGQMYLWDLPFLIGGFILLFKNRKGKWWILPFWLVIGIIPAAFARETPHALRTESTLPTWQIVTAFGFVSFVYALKRYQKIVASGLLIILLLFVGYYLHGYYTHYPKEYAPEWQYGYKQAIEYVKAHQEKYDKVYISGLERPYIYTLFYLQYTPQEFRSSAKVYTDVFGFVHVDGFGKYQFVDNPTSVSKPTKKDLFIAKEGQAPPKAKILDTIYDLDGTPAVIAFTQ